MAEPVFMPAKRGPPSIPRQIRVGTMDWVRIEQIAKEVGEPPSEIVRQAISFALKHMGRPEQNRGKEHG